MDIIRHPSAAEVNAAVAADMPLIAAVSSDGTIAYVAAQNTAKSHSAMLMQEGIFDLDNYYCLRFDSKKADWDFSCPHGSDVERISAYYRSGLRIIPEFLVMFGYFSKLEIKNAPPEIWEF